MCFVLRMFLYILLNITFVITLLLVVLPNGSRAKYISELLDYSSIIGGCDHCSTILGARMSNGTTFDTMSESLSMLFGDTLLAAKAYDSTLQADIQRIFSVGVLETASNESLTIAGNLKEKTRGVEIIIDNYKSFCNFKMYIPTRLISITYLFSAL